MVGFDAVEMSRAEEAEWPGEFGIFLTKLQEEVGVVKVEHFKTFFFCAS